MNNKGKKRDIENICFLGVLLSLFSLLLSLHAGSHEMIDGGDMFDNLIKSFSSISNPFNFKFSFLFIKYFGILILVIIPILFLNYLEFERVRGIDKESGGHAKWYPSFEKFAKAYTDLKNPDNNMILTKNVHLDMNSFRTKRNNNILVVGGSGSGKTRFMIKPNLMQANCSFVVTDPKGEILQTQGEMLRKNGYKIKVFNLTDMQHSNSYNPLKYIRDDNGVLMLINCLIKNTNNGKSGGDPFWEKSETALLQALIFYLLEKKDVKEEEKNFAQVMKMLLLAEVDENNDKAESKLDKMFKALESENEKSIAVKQYKIFKMGAGKTLKSILISTAVRLTVFNLIDIQDLTMSDDLDLEKIGDEKTALFVVIPAADDTFNFLVSMMYSQLFESLYYRAENQSPYEYYIKEGNDVLAIIPKSLKGNEQTKKEAIKALEKIKRIILNENFKLGKKISNKKEIYVLSIMLRQGDKEKNIPELKFVKEFRTIEEFEKFKERIKNAKIVKGKIKLAYDVRFLLDEFANIGQIPDFTKKLATMRQYGISCTIILQNLAQIKTMYKDDWESLVGNCDSFLFLGGQEYSTLEYISKLLGKTTIKAKSRGRSFSKTNSSSENLSLQSADLMSPSDISNMQKNECILIINGLNPFRDKKYDLTNHKRYDETGDSEKGENFDNKKEVFNAGYLARIKGEKEEVKNDTIENAIKGTTTIPKDVITLMKDTGSVTVGELVKNVQIIDLYTEENGEFEYDIQD